ncbi:ketopantoate hydroxymethyltransferase [Tumebacillus algifaecis]|uniref:Ketopantoate hydroxymethyltransferase n=1 Tax=Tumebacillus algifaecis TaxID=1214604 RepID=A0A223D5W8_9BACL|nr:ketopantoate hydroxymethyltransferase [Tumebacillus algifaecis]ASS76806.1 ketopantoate hydroxymethyltransferase [Tumebacillus algifaecis]
MIESAFLHDVASYTDSRIAKVVLNETHEITSFESRAITGSELILRFMVPSSAVSTITKIELKDAANNTVSSNVVYVPIATDTVISHTIKILEV